MLFKTLETQVQIQYSG